MLIMSYSAEPFAPASAARECQLAAVAERRPERRAISTAAPATTRTPSKIHSQTSEEPDPFSAAACDGASGDAEGAAGDAEGAAGDAEGAAGDAEGAAGAGAAAEGVATGCLVAGSLVGLGDPVPGENVAGEAVALAPAEELAAAFLILSPWAHPAAR
jgi:chromosome segregation protein